MTNTVASGLRRGTLTNTSGGNMPASIYNIVIGVADAGGPSPVGTNISFILDLRVVPYSVGSGLVDWCEAVDSQGDCVSGENRRNRYVAIEIQGGSFDGFYVYDIGANQSFSGWVSSCFGGNTITLNYTGRQTSLSGSPINSCIPAFANTLASAKQILDARNYNSSADYLNLLAQDTTGLTFEIT
jgi:hypothetical protein